MKKIVGCLALISTLIMACVPPSEEIKSDVVLDVKDPTIQTILDFQDRLQTDSLYPYLRSQDPTLVYLAIRAFASIQDRQTVDSIIGFLDHNNMDIRSIAAYAIGQIGDEKATSALIDNFLDKDTLDVDNVLNSNILEALGKISNEAIMTNIASVESYRPDDTLLILGQNRALYRFGLRNIKTNDATQAALKYTLDNQYPRSARLISANYLARNRDLDISLQVDDLVKTFKLESDPNIRICLLYTSDAADD